MSFNISLIEGKIKAFLFGNNGTSDIKLKTKTDGTLLVEERPQTSLGYAFIDQSFGVVTDSEIDFGAVCKDIHLEIDQNVIIKLNSSSNTGVGLGAGTWFWTDEYADRIFLTTTVTTSVKLYANG